MDHYEITQKEKNILNYIRKNPGKIKQHVVDYFDGKYSRKTVYKELHFLIGHNMVDVRKDKPNSQTHYLYINKDNLLLSTTTDLDEFKSVFFLLLDRAKEKYKQLESLKKPGIDYIPALEYTLTSSLYDIYKYFINVYILHSLFKWPKATKNKETLNLLNTTFFTHMQEVQSKISEAIISVYDPSQEKEQFIESMGKQVFVPQARFFAGMLKVSEFLKLDKEYESVIHHLWKISLDYIVFGTKNRKQDFKDWRKLLQEYR